MQQKPQTGRTIFVGDVHGCLQELIEMIELLQPRPEDDVILLGDLINRGPDPVGVVRYVHACGYESLMGNHEEEYLQLYKTEKKYMQLHAELGPELHNWIENRPLFVEADSYLAVHAGLQPATHPSQTDRRILLHIRTWDNTGQNLSNPENPPWYSYYTGPKPVFYGHWARQGLNIQEHTYGLDSGCTYGRKLSAYILEEKKLVQIQAKKVYYIPPSLRPAQS